MGGIVIDIWEKSNFLGQLDHKDLMSPAICRVKDLGSIIEGLCDFVATVKIDNAQI